MQIAVQQQNVDISDYVLEQGAFPDATDKHGMTPLLKAIDSKDMALVECLINHGASVNKCDHSFNTPLVVAVTENSLDLVRCLVENGADVDIPNIHGVPLKEVASFHGYTEIASYLTNLSESGVHLDDRLLENPLTAQDKLFCLCQTGKGTRHLIDELIIAGAEINGIDLRGRTPLIVATQNCLKQCVQWLLERKASVYERDELSSSAIEYAVQNEDTDIVALLLQNVGFENISGENIQTCLESAVNHCINLNSNISVCIANMLLEHCTCARLKENSIYTLMTKCVTFDNVRITQLLYNYQLFFDAFEPTIVIMSCISSNPHMLQCLMKYICDSRHKHSYIKLAVRFCLVNQLDLALCSLTDQVFQAGDIVWTSKNNFWSGSESHAFITTMEFVVDKSLDLYIQNGSGCTFLIFASSKGMVEGVKYLLWKGADKSIATKYGKDALEVAVDAGHYETAMLLTDELLVITCMLNAHNHIKYKIYNQHFHIFHKNILSSILFYAYDI